MEYTIKQLSDLAGITPRTLRWYDSQGLLKPGRVTEAGYRLYGPAEVDRLQQILFYRALDLPIAEIRTLLERPDFDRQAALQSHLSALEARRAQLDALILTVKQTLKGADTMSDAEKFDCFKQNVIKENEALHGAEVRAKYGDTAMDQANARDPAGEAGLDVAMCHKTWLSYGWDGSQYSPEAHRGLAALYTEDDRFTTYYDRTVPGCAAFLRASIERHI